MMLFTVLKSNVPASNVARVVDVSPADTDNPTKVSAAISATLTVKDNIAADRLDYSLRTRLFVN